MTKIVDMQLSDEQFVQGIQANNPLIIDRFIREYVPRIGRFLLDRGAKEKDVEDIAMTTVTAAYQNIRKDGFVLRSALSTYIFQIAKYQFLKQIDRTKLNTDTLPEGKDFVDDSHFLKDLDDAESTNLLWEKFYQLGEICQKVLTLWLEKTAMSEIARICGIPTEGAARVKKYNCLNSLKKSVWDDLRFN